MNIIKMLTKKRCYIGENKPAYVVIHETDNWSKGASAKAHATAMSNGNLAGTVHYYVDSTSIYQTLDHKDGAYAVGDGGGKYGITNRNSINIEICVNPESDYYKAVDNAEWLAAQLLKQYGWGTDRLKRHYDASGKHCPRRIMDEGLWTEFVKKAAAYRKGTPAETPKPPAEPQTPSKLFRVQCGAYANKANADALEAKLKKAGFETYMVRAGGLYKVQTGAYSKRENADAMLKKVYAAGFEGFITTEAGTPVAGAEKKSLDVIAREVLEGRWGNGQDRINRLKAAGYDPAAVQARVNQLA